jgi:hypothetical protein
MTLFATGPANSMELPEDVLPFTTVDTRVTTSSVTSREEPLKTDSDEAVSCELSMVESLHKNDHVLGRGGLVHCGEGFD